MRQDYTPEVFSVTDPVMIGAYERLGIPLEMHYDGKTIVHYFEESARRYPNQRMVLATGSVLDLSISFADMARYVRALSSALLLNSFFNNELERGHQVAVHLPTIHQACIGSLAVRRAGLVDIPIDPTWTDPQQIAHEFAKGDIKVVITTDYLLDAHLEAAKILGRDTKIIVTQLTDYYTGSRWNKVKGFLLKTKAKKAGRWLNISAQLKRHPKQITTWNSLLGANHYAIGNRAMAEDISTLIYGSGTSGEAGEQKLIRWTHRQLACQTQMMIAYGTRPIGNRRSLHVGEENILMIMPLSHSFGSSLLNLSVSMGAGMVLVPKPVKPIVQKGKTIMVFDPGAVVKIIVKNRPTMVALSPKHFRLMIDRWLKEHPTSLTFVKLFLSGSAKLAENTRKEWTQLTGARITEGFGLTETAAASHVVHPTDDTGEGTVGLPLPGIEFMVVNDQGEEVGYDVEGELLMRSPSLFDGYEGHDDATAKAMTEEGWLITGDLVIISSETGMMSITGRKKRISMPKGSGINVQDETVEAVILEHPDVEDVSVYAVDIIDGYEHLVASIMLKNPDLASDEMERSIKAHCDKLMQEKIAIPEFIEFITEVDIIAWEAKTGTGKLRYGVLAKRFKKQYQGG